MGILEYFLGPKSKYDTTIPYTYMAKVPAVRKEDGIFLHSFADTICGLIEYLEEKNIDPADVELSGIYQSKEIPLDKKICMDDDGNWLARPELCRRLEDHYQKTLEIQYKGHIEIGECSYEDRNREGSGSY